MPINANSAYIGAYKRKSVGNRSIEEAIVIKSIGTHSNGESTGDESGTKI